MFTNNTTDQIEPFIWDEYYSEVWKNVLLENMVLGFSLK